MMKQLILICLAMFWVSYAIAAERPNLVLIMADDFGYECVGANGGQSYRTPNLDQLAAGGMRFTDCHVQPLCTPTRVQLMTGVFNVRNYVNFGTLRREEVTFGQLLKQAGYATGICGKWQLGQDRTLPQHFGFDEACLWQLTRRAPRYANPGLEYNGEERDFRNGEYGPELVNDFAREFIARHHDRPFFLYYPMILTHDPFQPTPDSPDWDPQAQGEQVHRNVRHFAEMTAFMDKMVGRLARKLDDLKLREKTLVLFLGDNGTLKTVTSQLDGQPYQGGKGTTTCRGTHVPLIASWPGTISPGQVNHELISSVDFLPTLCEAAGAPVPKQIDGISFLPLLKGEKGTVRNWIYSWYSPRQKAEMTVQEFVFNRHHKLYRDGNFFDLTADPFEQKPIAAQEMSASMAGAAADLQAVLDHFQDARPVELDREFQAKLRRKAGKGNTDE